MLACGLLAFARVIVQELKLVEGVLELSDSRNFLHRFGRLFVQDFSILGKGFLEDLRILPRLAGVLEKTSALLLEWFCGCGRFLWPRFVLVHCNVC